MNDQDTRRRHHERTMEEGHRRDPVPAGDAAATDRWRQRRHDRQREYLLRCAGLRLEDLDEDTRRYVDHLTEYGDTPEVAGVAALVEASRGHVTGGEPARTAALRVDSVSRPRCCDTPTPEATWGLGSLDDAFVTVWCGSCRTDLLILDPPSTGNTAPYVGDLRRGVEPVGPWDED